VIERPERTVVRRIRADEGALLRELRLRSLADAPDAFGQRLEDAAAQPDAEWAQVARASAEGDQRAWYLAFSGESAVGLVLGRRRRPATLLLFSMWVAPEARRGGSGARLVAALEDWARAWRASETLLWVMRSNEAALAFYRQVGFRTLTEGPDVASGVEHGAFAMRRPIR
jgi:GNAT superfamily N-acetyltransferase